MPKIKIYESDLTTPGGLNTSNIVYIPGFFKKASENNMNGQPIEDGIHLFRNVNEFKSYFTYPGSNNSYKFEYLKINSNSDDKDNEGKLLFNTPERSMVYAIEVLQAGLPIYFDAIGVDASVLLNNGIEGGALTDVNLKALCDKKFEDLIKKILDRNNYDVKFITTGGYPNTGAIEKVMLEVAHDRGDCVALIDHEENKRYEDLTILYSSEAPTYGEFGAMFTPWCTFEFSSKEPEFDMPKINMPGSFAYLKAFGTSISNKNSNWLAVAGATRGFIPNLIAPLENLTEAQIDNYSLTDSGYVGVAINPIATINPYGTIIWGNRTLNKNKEGLVASSFLNIRQLTNDIKKIVYKACKSITFEQNSDLTWIKFKSLITPLLDQMQTGDGISGYEIKKKKTTKKATIVAAIRIYPIEAVEDFEITIELADEATNVIG